jgi:large subunit ribosomal protein L24
MHATRPLTKPTKQRKMLYKAPAHLRHKLLAAHLSPELRASHGTKSFPVRSGDTVHVARGDHKGVEGKITRVDLSRYRIYVEGLTREKVDGTTINVPIHPSKVIVTRLNLDDKWRKDILDSRKEALKRLEKVEKAEKIAKKPKSTPGEKPTEVAEAKPEKIREVVEEKPAAKARAPKKRVAKAKKKPVKKKGKEEVKTEAEEARMEQVKKAKPVRKTKRIPRKTTKKSEEGEE